MKSPLPLSPDGIYVTRGNHTASVDSVNPGGSASGYVQLDAPCGAIPARWDAKGRYSAGDVAHRLFDITKPLIVPQ